jgi:hypothetical protein
LRRALDEEFDSAMVAESYGRYWDKELAIERIMALVPAAQTQLEDRGALGAFNNIPILREDVDDLYGGVPPAGRTVLEPDGSETHSEAAVRFLNTLRKYRL